MTQTPAHDNAGADSASVEVVMHRWEQALAAHDAAGLLACCAPNATLESPVAAHITGQGRLEGHDQLRPLFVEVLARTPEIRTYHRQGFFTDGRRATWEYPRGTPEGEQMDFVEVMEIDEGLIRAHRVYWGWRGVQVLLDDRYHRDRT